MHFRMGPGSFGHYADGKLFEKEKKAFSLCSSCNYPLFAYLLLFLIRAIRIIITDSANVLITLQTDTYASVKDGNMLNF